MCILIFYCFYQIMVNKDDCGNDLTLHHIMMHKSPRSLMSIVAVIFRPIYYATVVLRV